MAFTYPTGVVGPSSVTIIKTDPLPRLPPGASAAARLARFSEAVALVSTPFPAEGKWRADVALSQTHNRAVSLTELPVEQGVNITDHSRRTPDRLSFVGLISDSPFSPLGFPPFVKRSLDQLRKLEEFFEAREPVFVATSVKVYDSMIITSLAIDRAPETGDALQVSLQLQEIRIQNSILADALLDEAAAQLGAGAATDAGTLAPF